MPAYYRQFGGAVVSTAIDKYVYVSVNRKFDDWIRVSYSKTEEVQHVHEVEHKIVRAALEKLNIQGGLEITSVADIPSRGTGLGSSSSFTVGLLHALHAFQHLYISASDLGAEASYVEIELCGEKIGKQDQYAAAFGGLNYIRFEPDDSVFVEPIICQRETLVTVKESLVAFYTGRTRAASSILAHQSEQMANNRSSQAGMQRMVTLAGLLREELSSNHPEALGQILHENWMLKREMAAGISDSQIDEWYDLAIRSGAIGGKLLGAGGGGFLLFYAPAEKHPAIEKALSGLRRIPFSFDPRGSRIILYQN